MTLDEIVFLSTLLFSSKMWGIPVNYRGEPEFKEFPAKFISRSIFAVINSNDFESSLRSLAMAFVWMEISESCFYRMHNAPRALRLIMDSDFMPRQFQMFWNNFRRTFKQIFVIYVSIHVCAVCIRNCATMNPNSQCTKQFHILNFPESWLTW
jgi:hypothetical protein